MEAQDFFLPGFLQTTGVFSCFLLWVTDWHRCLNTSTRPCPHTVLTVLRSECHFTLPINLLVITQGDLSLEKQNGWALRKMKKKNTPKATHQNNKSLLLSCPISVECNLVIWNLDNGPEEECHWPWGVQASSVLGTQKGSTRGQQWQQGLEAK